MLSIQPFFILAICLSGLIPNDWKYTLLAVVISFVPTLSLYGFLLCLAKIFSEQELENGKESLLISSAIYFPSCLVLLLVSLINLGGFLSPPQIIALLAGLGIYAVAFAVLMLFNACTRVLGIKGSGTVFVVATLLLVSSGITGFFYQIIIN